MDHVSTKSRHDFINLNKNNNENVVVKQMQKKF